MTFRCLSFLALAVAPGLIACAGHSADTLPARNALNALNPKKALEVYNELLDVDSVKEPVRDVSDDSALFLLDRSTVLQQLDQYEYSSRDLEIADKQVEILDLSRGAIDDIGKYLYSDDSGPYKAPAYEKVMINTLNMVNYLVRKDLNGARIEARRLAVMQKFLSEHEQSEHAWVGPGSYVAGFVFEQSGSSDEAMRFYSDALEHGLPTELGTPVVRLAKRTGTTSPKLTALEQAVGESAKPEGTGDVLIVVSYGRVPAKKAVRLPIGLALTLASGHISPYNQARANELAAQGLVTWINFPSLPKPKPIYETPYVAIDNVPSAAPSAVYAIDEAAVDGWNEAKGAMIASAITRMITRIVAGVAARNAVKNDILGVLLSLGTQATLTALDTPDTRSWGTLPSHIAIWRVSLPAGHHTISLSARGGSAQRDVTVLKNGWSTVNLTVLR